jgi:hypothetical protein
VGRVARWLGEDADWVADRRSLAELNYVHSNLNTVHLSRSAFNEGEWSRGGGAASAPAGHASFRRLPLPTGARPRCGHPTQHHQDRCRPKAPCHRVVAEVLAVFTDRSSEFSSVVCVAVCDRAGTGGVPWAALGRAWITPSPSRSSPPSRSSSSTASITASAPKREPGSSVAVGGRVADHLPRALGSPVVAGRRPISQPSGRSPSRRRPPVASRKSGPPSWAGCYARGFKSCSGELVASCWCWTKWCTDAVEMADGFGVGAEHGRLAVGEVVLLAECPD